MHQQGTSEGVFFPLSIDLWLESILQPVSVLRKLGSLCFS
jgi:hypothetical protein